MKHNKNKWVIVSCQCNLADEDTCSWLLFEHGALGLEIENLNEQAISVKASFAAEQLRSGIDDLSGKFVQADLSDVAKTLQAETIANQDWMSNWKKHFEPFAVGDSFLVCPPWRIDEVTSKQLGKRKKIIIDPGMAFGTGLHATTKFCLQAIEEWAKGAYILDIGTGSGILAIACAITLPEAKILALEIEPDAIANAKHNIALNQVENNIELKLDNAELLAESCGVRKFDVILSNLTAETIVGLLPLYFQLLEANGVLVLAGIFKKRLKMLESYLDKYSFKTIHKAIDSEWVGLILAKSTDRN